MSSNSVPPISTSYRPNIRPFSGQTTLQVGPGIGKPRLFFLDTNLVTDISTRRNLLSPAYSQMSLISQARETIAAGISAIRERFESAYTYNVINSLHSSTNYPTNIQHNLRNIPMSATELIYSKPLHKQLLAIAVEQVSNPTIDSKNINNFNRHFQHDSPSGDFGLNSFSTETITNSVSYNTSTKNINPPLKNKASKRHPTYRDDLQSPVYDRKTNDKKNKKAFRKTSLLNKLMGFIFGRIINRV